MKKALLFLLVLVFALNMAASAALALTERWTVSVVWINPPISGSYLMDITINDPTWPRDGTVYAPEYGNRGAIRVNRDGTVSWDWDQVAFYSGRASSRTSASGTMYNIWGNTGTWTAVRGSYPSSGASSPSAALIGAN